MRANRTTEGRRYERGLRAQDEITQEELAEVRSIVHDLANLSCERSVQINALSEILADAQPSAAQLVGPVSSRELEGQELLRQGGCLELSSLANQEKTKEEVYIRVCSGVCQ